MVKSISLREKDQEQKVKSRKAGRKTVIRIKKKWEVLRGR